ncbi:hypothetical protein ACF0H5_020643 [Mactra antiquata]
MNISFCGSGFLGIYHIGATQALVNHAPNLLSRLSKVGGASAGALVAALLVCDTSKLEACKMFNLTFAEDIRKKPLGALTPGFDLTVPLAKFMREQLLEDAYIKANGRLHISVSSFKSGIPTNKVISCFSSNEMLIKYLIASCYIPVYAGFKPPVIDNTIYTDGGLINNLIIFDEGRTVTVSPFCGDQDICPADDKGLDWKFKIKNQTFQFNKKNGLRAVDGLFPPSHDKLLSYHDIGYNNAVTFLKSNNFYES